MDWGLVTQHYGKNFQDKGGDIKLNFEVTGFELAPEGQMGSSDGNKYPLRVKGNNNQVSVS